MIDFFMSDQRVAQPSSGAVGSECLDEVESARGSLRLDEPEYRSRLGGFVTHGNPSPRAVHIPLSVTYPPGSTSRHSLRDRLGGERFRHQRIKGEAFNREVFACVVRFAVVGSGWRCSG
jgi:hypothetical protein